MHELSNVEIHGMSATAFSSTNIHCMHLHYVHMCGAVVVVVTKMD